MLTGINLKNAKKFCIDPVESIEGYKRAMNEPDQFDLHHKLEEQGYSREELISKGLYYNRPAEELVFLTHKEHAILHGSSRSEETRRKISKALKGNQHGKGKPKSEETKRKLSESQPNKIDICPALLQIMRYEQHLSYQKIGEHFGISATVIMRKLRNLK